MKARAALAALLLAAAAAQAADGVVVFKVADAGKLRLFLRDADGRQYGRLGAVADAVEREGHHVVFAMNAGMYEADRTPTGLYVAAGQASFDLNVRRVPQSARTPNFYLEPNGVFALTAQGPAIVPTREWARAAPAGVTLATQSGPLLLKGRTIVAPAVARGTDAPANRRPRNGVCVNGREVVLVEADAMTLHQFAVHLRDVVGCVDALYLDGGVSVVLDRRSGRRDETDPRDPLGPIIAVVE